MKNAKLDLALLILLANHLDPWHYVVKWAEKVKGEAVKKPPGPIEGGSHIGEPLGR